MLAHHTQAPDFENSFKKRLGKSLPPGSTGLQDLCELKGDFVGTQGTVRQNLRGEQSRVDMSLGHRFERGTKGL